MIYLLLGAPDLALTQLLVETLTLVIITLVLFRLKTGGTGRAPGVDTIAMPSPLRTRGRSRAPLYTRHPGRETRCTDRMMGRPS